MQSQNTQSRQGSQIPDPYTQNAQKTMFQKYSNMSGKLQKAGEQDYSPHLQLGNYGEQKSSHEAKQSHVEGQVQSQYQQHDKESLIQSVDRQMYAHEQEIHLQKVQNLQSVQQASSKIIHRPITVQDINSSVQNQHYVASNNVQRQQSNISVPMIQNQVPVQSNNMRHTITGSQSQNYTSVNQVVSNQNFNVRGSLPPNLMPGQYINSSHYSGSSQNQSVRQNQQIIIPSQVQTVPARPNVVLQQPLQGQQQIIRTPQHMPQKLAPGQKIQSQTLFQHVDFIKNAPQRLQTSEIVYKERSPNMSNQPLMMNPIQQNQGQLSRGQSLQMIRENTRSMERRGTNVIFNYKIQQTQSVPIRQVQAINISGGSFIQQRPVSIPPKPIITGPIETQPKPLQVQQPVKQALTAPIVQKERNIWQQRYFALYSKLLQMNKKSEFIGEDFIKFERVISQIKEQKPHKRYHRLQGVIQELQQDFTSIVHQWKPEGEIKLQSKQAAHIEMKYKRLLYNFSKLQEENTSMKKNLQEKIHEVVVKLQKQNESLKSKLAEIPQPQVPKMSSDEKQQLQEKIAKLHQKNRTLQDEIARLSQANEKLLLKSKDQQRQKSPIQTKEEKTVGVQNIENIIEQLNEKIRSYQRRTSSLEGQNNQLRQMNEQLQEEINSKISQINRFSNLQTAENRLQEELIKRDVEIEQRTKQIKVLQEQNKVLQQGNTMLADDVQKLNEEISQLQGQLRAASEEIQTFKLRVNNNIIEQQQFITKQSLSMETDHQSLAQIQQQQQQSQKLQTLQIQLTKQQQKTIFFRQQLARVNSKNSQLQKQLNKFQQQFKSQLISTQQLSSLESTISHHQKDSLEKLQLIQQLEGQNNKLHAQNVTLREELQKLNEKFTAHETQFNEYRTQIHHYQAQIQEYQQSQQKLQKQQSLSLIQQQQLSSQQSTSPPPPPTPQPPQSSPLLIQQYEFTIATLRSQINRKQNQIQRQSKLSDQRILDLTQQLKLSYKQRENLHKKFEQKTMLLESQREKKEILIRQLRDKIYDLEHKKRLDESQDKRRRNYQNQLIQMNDNKQITKLKQQLQTIKAQRTKQQKQHSTETKKLTQQNQQLTQDNFRLKKQIAELASSVNQLETMTEAFNKKNMEILELKNIAFENQKLLIQINNQKKQNQRQLQENERVTLEYEKINKTYLQLSRNYKEIEQTSNILNTRFTSLQGQYTTNLDAYQRKQQEANKYKQLNQQLQNQYDQTERENQKLKNKLKNLQNSAQQQIHSLKQQLQILRNKLIEFDNTMREKALAEHKVTELQGFKQKYQYQLKENQQLITKQKSKIKTLQSQNEDLTQQVQGFNDKIKEQEKKSSQTTKKYKKLLEDLQQKNKALQQRQAKIQKEKINELQTDIKAKQNKIWKLQKQLEQALERLDDFGDQEMASQKILYLQQKVKEYQSRLFNQAFKFSPSSYDYEASKVFERQVIYELKEQNQRLREFIHLKKSVKPTNDRDLESSKIGQQIKQAYDQELDQVQGRLATFNTKLESLIKNGSYENIQVQNKKASKSPIKIETKTFNANSALKVAESQVISRELRQLKLKYAELERYCKNIEIQLLSGNGTSQKTVKTSKVIISSSNQTIANDQVTFLKQKNRQLEERVDKLLIMNNQLKENIENLLKQKSDSSSLTYYKEQISELNDKISANDVRIKKLLDQNEKLKTQNNILTKSEETMQVKVFDYERRSIELQRMINEHNLTKSSLDKDLQSRIQLLQAKQFEINEIRGQLSLSGQKESIVVKSCKQQIENYESQVTKLTNKIRIQESEIQRLNQTMRKKQSDSTQEVGRWRSKANQLQEDLSKLSGEHDDEMKIQSSLKFEVSHLEQELKASQYENQQLNEVNQNLTRRLQQSEGKVREFKMDKEMLESDLSGQTSQGQQMAAKIQQQQQQIYRMINQIEVLKQQIQRLNDQNRTKQRTSEFEIRTLQDKLSYTEKDLLNLRKYTSTLEDEKRSFEQELSKNQFQVSLLFKEIQERDRIYSEKQAAYEDKVMMLKSQITAIESSSASLQQNMSAINILRQKYEAQTVELRNQVVILRSEIERYQQIVREKDSMYQQLQNDYAQLDEQRTKQQSEIVNLLNQNGILNSEIDRLMSTIVEKDTNLTTIQGSSESLDREVNKCINQITSLRQQNETLIENIKQLEKSRTSDVNAMSSQISILKRQNEDSKRMLQELRSEKQGMEEQLTRWMNRVSLLGQQNEKLISRTKSIESMSSLSSELQALKRQKEELRAQLTGVQEQLQLLAKEYHQKISFTQQKISSLAYLIELNRSVYLEVESLVDQLQYSTAEEAQQVREKIGEELQKGIKDIKEQNQILKGVTFELSTQYQVTGYN